MTITYDHGDIIFKCDADKCRETLETRTSNFESARNLMKRAHWKPIKRKGFGDDNWDHHCPDCQLGLFAHGKRRSEHAGSSV